MGDDSDSVEEPQLNIAETAENSRKSVNENIEKVPSKPPPVLLSSVVIPSVLAETSPPKPQSSTVATVSSVVERASNKDRLLDLKRRAALICNIPELASTSPKKKKKEKRKVRKTQSHQDEIIRLKGINVNRTVIQKIRV